MKRLLLGGLGLLVAALALAAIDVALLLAPAQVDARVRALLQQTLVAPHELAAVELGWDRLTLRGFEAYDPVTGALVARVPEASVELHWGGLDLGTIRVNGPELHIRRDRDGRLNLLDLIDPALLEGGGDVQELPGLRVEVRGARITLGDEVVLAKDQVLALAHVDVDVATGGDRITATARVEEPWLRSMRADLEVDLARRSFELGVEGEKVVVREATRELLPPSARRVFNRLRPHGVADVSLAVRAEPGAPVDVAGQVRVHNGGLSVEMFPYAAEDATGTIEVSRTLVKLRDLVTESDEGRITCNGEIYLGGPGEDERIDIRLDAENILLGERFRAALPREAAKVYGRFSPAGRASGLVRIHGAIRGQGHPDEVSVDVDARPLGMSARFADVPVPIEGVHGRLEVHLDVGPRREGRPYRNDAALVVIDELRARAAGGDLAVRGSAGEAQVSVRVEGRGLFVDEQLTADLGRARAAAERLRPRGVVDLDVEVFDRPEQPRDGGLEVGFEVAVAPRPGFEVVPRDFPYPLTLESGTVRVDADAHASIEAVRARAPGARRIEVNGRVVGAGGAAPASAPGTAGGTEPSGGDLGLDLVVVAERVRVDALLRQALLAATGGRPDAANEPGASGGSATAATAATAAPAATAATAAGTVGGEPPAAGGLGRLWEELGLELTGTIERADLRIATETEGQRGLEIGGRLRFDGVAATPRVFPYRLRNVRGEVGIEPDAVAFVGVEATTGLSLAGEGWLPRVGSIAIDGRLPLDLAALEREPRPGGAAVAAAAAAAATGAGPADRVVRVRVRDLAIDETLAAALPPSLRSGLEAIGPRPRPNAPRQPVSGVISADGFILLALHPGQERLVWNAETRASARRVDFGLIFDDVEVAARLHGSLPLGAPGEAARFAEGQVIVERASWKQQPIELAALLVVDPRELELRQVRGRFLGGTLASDLVFYRHDGTRFGGRFTLSGGRIERFVGLPKDFYGSLDGWIAFDGVPNAPDARIGERLRGTGRFDVREARLFAIPDPADRASAGVRLEHDRVVLESPLELGGAAFTFRGRGFVDFDSNLDIRLAPAVTDFGEGVPVIELLGKAVGWVSRQFLGVLSPVWIRGTVKDPKVYWVPVVGLDVPDFLDPGTKPDVPSVPVEPAPRPRSGPDR